MRVLVCGGRDFSDASLFEATMARLDAEQGIRTVIEGEARGTDSMAREWALGRGKRLMPFRADWKGLGRRAGPLRNTRMLVEGKPDLVVAFPGGTGTADMMRQARAAGVVVVEVEPMMALD